MTPEKHIRAFVSLCRYRDWSTTLRALVAPTIQEFDRGELKSGPTVALLSYWFASLFVLAEGWRDLSLSDPAIDALLTADHVDILRRYRNGVFHYQQDFADNRFTGMISEGLDTIRWVKELDSAFDMFFSVHRARLDVRSLASWISGASEESAS